MRTLSFIPALLLCLTIVSCSGRFTRSELALIRNTDPLMRVLTVNDSSDLNILRSISSDLSGKSLMSDEFKRLSEKMVRTVTDPSQDGVGIAAPQVGINRRIVAVQRFDKEGFPFEVYANIRIIWASDSLEYGPEGCLSVPDRRREVKRSRKIVIEYADPEAVEKNFVPVVRDTVTGFTAVIFQHETDHLDGILYTDRL